MNIFRSARIALVCLAASLLSINSLAAYAATVPAGACLYALDATASRAFQIAGAQSVYTACGVVSESSASDGFEMEGSETLYLQNHAQVSVVGGAQLNGQTQLWDTISNKQVQPVKVSSPGDPLASVVAPTSGTIVSKSHVSYDMNNKPTNNTLSPGVYCGGLAIGNTNGTTFTLSPGVYIMAGGGLTLNSQAVVAGTGVTIYNTSSAGWGCSSSYSYTPVTISGQVTAKLSAPTSGTYEGILFFGNRAGCATSGSCVDQINGGSTAILNGALYFKSDEIEITGSNASGYMELVADKIYINGNSTFGITGDPFDGISVSISPSTAILFAGQTQQFTATVNNSSNSAVTWSISPSGVGSISSTGLYTAPSSVTAGQTVTITATSQADTSKSSTATVTLAVNKTTPTIIWAKPAALTYGTALSSTQLDATSTVAGSFTYTPAAGTVLSTGSQTLSVTFTPTNTTLYSSANATVPLTVNKATPTISWSMPASIAYGTALSATQLDATSAVAGSFTYTPAAGTVLAAGSQTLSVTFTPSDSTDYTLATTTVALTVNQTSQTINFTPLASPVIFGVSPITLSASATSGLAVTFSVISGPATVSGNNLTITDVGTVVIAANQAGNSNYSAATQVTQSVTVNQATPTITTWPTASSITYGQTLTSSTQSGGSASVGGTFAWTTPNTAPNGGTASQSVTFTPTDTTDYISVIGAANVTVNSASQTITFTPPVSPVIYGVSPITLSATASSGLAVTFSVLSGPATVSGDTLTIIGAGAVVVAANQAGNANYSAAPQVTQSITVSKATPTINWATPAAITYSTALSATQLDATSTVAGTFAYTPAAGTVLAAGSQSLSVAFTPTDATDYSTATANVTLAVSKNTPTITWPTPAGISYGTALNSTQLDATSPVAGSFAYTPASGTVLAAGSQTLSATFTPTDTTDYNSATTTITLVVSKATPTITWATPAGITYGTALSATQLDATSTVAGNYTYTPAAGTVLAAGTQTLSVTFTPTDTTDYNTATATVPLTVSKATPVLTWATPAEITYGTALTGTQLDATSGGVAGSFVYTPALGAVLAAGSQTLSVTFTPTGTADYNTATATVTLTVNLATPTISWATPTAITYGTALSATQLDATSTIAGTFAYSPAAGTVLAAGPQTLLATFTPTDTTDYNTATASVTLTVNQAAQTINFTAPAAPVNYGVAPIALTATASSGLPVSFSVLSGPGTISNSTLTITGVGTVVVAANQAGNNNYVAAAQVTQSITVNSTSAQCGSNGYGYRRVLTINHTQVPNTDQTNFPYLFNTTDPLLATTAYNGHVASPNGYDIIFTSDAAGQNILNYEMEEYNPATGQVVVWVKIPLLSHTQDTVIYVWYGNASITTLQSQPSSAWDSRFKGVWHFRNGTTLSTNDSTANGNNGTNYGAIAAPGQINEGASFNENSNYVDVGNLGNFPTQGTIEFWMQPSSLSSYPNAFSTNYNGGNDAIRFEEDASGDFSIYIGSGSYNSYSLMARTMLASAWYHIALTWDSISSNAIGYVNGAQVFNTNSSNLWPATIPDLAIGSGYNTSRNWNGLIDEARISTAARSADWIATEYNNESSPSTFYQLSSENPVFVTPTSAFLYSSQSQQFSANSCSGSVNWQLTPSSAGSLTADGLYTAPSGITAQQIVTVTATDPVNSDNSASATITLWPSVAVSVTPTSASLYGGQSLQFTSTVLYTNNTAVTWTISPASAGSISTTGLFTATTSPTAGQTVTVTATSQADPTKSASATVTLSLAQCASNGYGYRRVLTIDHTKVPNTDQTNFPYLFNTTDPLLATTTYNGHVASPNGYDIIFTSDAAGQNILNYEMEEYNPATGQVVAWVQIPLLSHTQDTVIYVWYGNASVTTLQTQPSSVWDSNFKGVWHLPNGTTLSTKDSTANRNNGTNYGAIAAPGQIDGGASFSANSNYVDVGNLGNFPTQGTIEFWMQPSSLSSYPNAFSTNYNGGNDAIRFEEDSSGDFDAIIGNGNFNGYALMAGTMQSGAWYHIALTWDSISSNAIGYVNGAQVFNTNSSNLWPATIPDLAIGSGFASYRDWNGLIDEARISTAARSADWVATEYNNESSPSTFYTLYPENTVKVVPTAVSLYAAQSQQFTAAGACGSAITWSMPSDSQGSLMASGLYIAPDSISSVQTVAITATNQTTGTTIGTSTVTLLPTPAPITLVAAAQSPYVTGSSQGFVATLLNQYGVPESGVTVNFTVTGANTGTGSIVTDAYGIASYAYIGANSGTDTIVARATVNGQMETSNNVQSFWDAQPASNTAGSVKLLAGVDLGLYGLCGAFTDNSGVVIEPIAIGKQPRVFVTPTGATQLQLGINDDIYNNWGSGYVVEVNGVMFTVQPDSTPWLWTAGGLNTNYKYGTSATKESPTVVLTDLTAGQEVNVIYQNGYVDGPGFYSPDADGWHSPSFYHLDPSGLGGTSINPGNSGTHFSTIYMYNNNLPIGQTVSATAMVEDSNGNPVGTGVPVTFTVTGANPQQYQTKTNILVSATTTYNGIATFTYSGVHAGADTVVARAYPASENESKTGQAGIVSSSASITWIDPAKLPPSGKMVLTPNTVQPLPVGGQLSFTVFASDASGAPVSNVRVGLSVSGADFLQLSGTTDATGHAKIVYQDVNSGTSIVQATALIDGIVVYSNTVSVPWTLLAATTTTPTTNCNNNTGTMSGSVSAQNIVTLPNTLQLNGTITDDSLSIGSTSPTVVWSEVSGPGTVTFTNSQQAVSTTSFSEVGTATFSQAGKYVLQLNASDSSGNCTGGQFPPVTVNAVPDTSQGWLGSPLNYSSVSGLVPITLASEISVQSGMLTYYPANNPNNVSVLNANTTGSGQIGVLDTTALTNGSYWIELQATDANGKIEYSIVLVTVVGNYKPGRVTASVTDLIVPATGLAINIQRQYDSLNASTIGDFGYGWNLGINVNLTVDNKNDVTFTLGGQRKTFYFTPQQEGCSPLIGCIFPWYYVVFTPEPGLYGTLTDSAPGCADGLDLLTSTGYCYGGDFYTPPGYIYTDPSGTSYTISANGNLQSIQDLSGNGLTITANGITSTTGLSVPFVRDSSNRITQITDPQGNIYSYSYDGSGNLASVTYPYTTQTTALCANTTQPNTSTYTYDSNHLYTGGTDALCHALPSSAYYPSGTNDASGNSLSGRLQSVTDATGNTTNYAYDLTANTTTVTYPADANGSTGTVVMTYDSYGMLLSTKDPLGLTTINTYNVNHKLTSVTDPLGHTTSYTYDSNGNKTSSTYPVVTQGVNTTSYTAYNQYSEPTSTTDELGNVRTFNYDASYNPLSVTDTINGAPATLASFIFNANGTLQAGAIGYDITAQPSKASQFTYDSYGNMGSRTDALGRVTSYTYNTLGQKVTSTPPLPNASTSVTAVTTTYQYDAFGHLTQTAAPLGRTTGSTYDANGNKLTDTDALGNVTSYQYDALNRLTTTTYPTTPVTTTTKTYDFRNNVIDETDQAGHVTHHVYDLSGRQTSVTKAYGTPLASTTSTTYYDDGRKQSETDTLGHVTNYTYDAAGRLTSISGVKGNTSYGYDAAGNRISSADGNGNTTQFQYDARKRLVKTLYPDGTSTTNTYDGPGNLSAVTDQAGKTVQYAYDAANQLQSVVQVSSPNAANTTGYTYDPLGNLASLSDANGHATQNVFDLFSDLTGKTLPDGTLQESRTYDTAGNLVSLQHFNGKTTSFVYDALSRLTTRIPDPSLGEPTVSFTYTATNKRATMVDGSGQTTYSYDPLDRLTTKATPEGSLFYGYDGAGNLASISSNHANGILISLTYDSLNRLSTVVDNRLPAGSNTTTYAYDPANNVVTRTAPNGLQTTFSYDSLNRITSQTTPVSSYTYTLGSTGNRTGAVEGNGRTLKWNYDGIYRLTNESISNDPANNNGSVGYDLDPVGNRISDSSTLQGIASVNLNSFNLDDWLSRENYDSNGNTTYTGGRIFVYDSENHLMSMNGGAVKLIYDGDGNRVAKIANGVTTQYLVDDLNLTGYSQVVEEVVNGTVSKQYTYGLERINETQVVSNTWQQSFYGYDGFGSVRQLTNLASVVTDTYSYDAFGNLLNSTGTTPNNYLYRAEQYDPDLGLYYLRARYYNPATGRFVGRDPFDGYLNDPATLHKYLYTGGDPVNLIDPSGRDIFELTLVDRLVVLTAATGTAYVAMTHSTTNSGALGALGITVACSIESVASKLSAEVSLAIQYGGNGEVFQVGDCTWSFKGSKDGDWNLSKWLDDYQNPPPPPPDRCSQIRAKALAACSELYVGRGYGSDAPGLVQECVRDDMERAGCSY